MSSFFYVLSFFFCIPSDLCSLSKAISDLWRCSSFKCERGEGGGGGKLLILAVRNTRGGGLRGAELAPDAGPTRDGALRAPMRPGELGGEEPKDEESGGEEGA